MYLVQQFFIQRSISIIPQILKKKKRIQRVMDTRLPIKINRILSTSLNRIKRKDNSLRRINYQLQIPTHEKNEF